jgi:chromosome segregation ATPase
MEAQPMARWNDAMLDRLADLTQANAEAITRLEAKVEANAEAITRLEAKVEANAEAITRLEAKVEANTEAIRELREGQAMMMQIVMRQQSSIEELRQDTRNMQADVRLMLDTLTRNYPNGHSGTA